MGRVSTITASGGPGGRRRNYAQQLSCRWLESLLNGNGLARTGGGRRWGGGGENSEEEDEEGEEDEEEDTERCCEEERALGAAASGHEWKMGHHGGQRMNVPRFQLGRW